MEGCCRRGSCGVPICALTRYISASNYGRDRKNFGVCRIGHCGVGAGLLVWTKDPMARSITRRHCNRTTELQVLLSSYDMHFAKFGSNVASLVDQAAVRLLGRGSARTRRSRADAFLAGTGAPFECLPRAVCTATELWNVFWSEAGDVQKALCKLAC